MIAARFGIALACLVGAGWMGTLTLSGALGAGWGAAAVVCLILGAIAAPNVVD